MALMPVVEVRRTWLYPLWLALGFLTLLVGGNIDRIARTVVGLGVRWRAGGGKWRGIKDRPA